MKIRIENQKKIIAEKLFKCLEEIDSVISVSIVGSFCYQTDLCCISDIDTIVICDHLTQALFDRCVQSVEHLNGSDLGMPERSVYVNPTFGPLKYDDADLIVVHLMIYDLKGHRNHVLRSPFTCYDWERSQLYTGLSLHQIYPVLKLQPRDFHHARRGLQDYLNDLDQKVISYRRYEFQCNTMQEVLTHRQLDSRHQGEYAFHIVKNLVGNYIKMLRQENILLSHEALIEAWERHLPDCRYFIPFYGELRAVKLARGLDFPSDTVVKVRTFVEQFEQQFKEFWEASSCLKFVRHAQTDLNDGSFLGQGRDPGIQEDVEIRPLGICLDRVFSSPLKRALQTASCLAPSCMVVEDDRLSEIDYGKAEGLRYAELKQQSPDIIDQWDRGQDACFPQGENMDAVYNRLISFLDDRKQESGTSMAVTHNVVLRCLAGQIYQIDQEEWHRIRIPHGIEMDVQIRDGIMYPNFNTTVKAAVTDGIMGIPQV